MESRRWILEINMLPWTFYCKDRREDIYNFDNGKLIKLWTAQT